MHASGLMGRLSALFLLVSAGLSAQVPAAVPALDPAGLTQILKSGRWTLVEFGGPTCVPCKKMQPILAEVQRHHGDRLQVRNYYLTQYAKEAKPYKVMVMPTQVLFDPAGREVLRHMGFWSLPDMQAALAKAGLK